MDSLQEILKSRAVRKAHRQGRVMSDALGQSLGPAIYISDSGFNVYNSMKGRSTGISMSADDSETGYVALPADFDRIRAEANVQVKFRLE